MNLKEMMNNMNKINLAIVGATGVVGRKFLEVIDERKIPFENLYLFASKKSAGKDVSFQGKTYTVIELNEENIKKYDIDFALFSAGGSTALTYAPIFAKQKTIVIDNSSAFRMDKNVPLVVPEVNKDAAFKHNYIIANPNCSTIQAALVLKPLHDQYNLKRVVMSTYQAVSGAGIDGIYDLENELKTGETKKFPYQIYHNVIPQIDIFLEDGNTKEEDKMMNEMRKILNLPDLKITATAVRVPVVHGHSESINIEFNQDFDINHVKSILKQAPNVVVYDDPSELKYPMPILAEGKDEVFVGRIRRDQSLDYGMNCFVVADNIRKGAATNAVQILELFL
jgi:aspartate-semialdehyde dehydrogenase